MNSKEFEALLRAEVEEAKAHYESAQRALEAYLGNANEDDGLPKRRNFPDRQPTSVAVAVRKIIPQFTDDVIFTAEDVFGAMGMVTGYEKMRSSISSTLTRLVNEGRIEKVNRRCFRKSMQVQTNSDL
jgi:hypothetical protein